MPASSTNRQSLYLLDAMSLVFQAFYAIRHLTSPKGEPTNAVFGFAKRLERITTTYEPHRLIALFDSGRPTFRNEIYPEYKANREDAPEEFKSQIPLVFELLDAMGIHRLAEKGFEADDLIGTLAKKAAKKNWQTVIISADKDLFQLLNDKVTMLRPNKDGLQEYTPQTVKEKMGVTPEQMIDYLALVGDSSDNIPGVPKIGPKTAVSLLEEYGSLEKILEKRKDIAKKSIRESLEQNVEQARLSYELATIKTDMEIALDEQQALFQPRGLTPELAELYRNWGFSSLLKEARNTPKKQMAVQEDLFPQDASQQDLLDTHYQTILDAGALKKAVEEAKKVGIIAFDTETSALNTMRAELVGLSFSWKAGEGVYVPLGHNLEGDRPRQISLEAAQKILNPLLSDREVTRVAQNAKFDVAMLKRHGFDLAPVQFDTMLASYLLNPESKHGLKAMALSHLNVEMTEIEALIGKGKNSITMDQVEIDRAAPYACADADMTFRLYEIFLPQLKENGLMDLFENIEMPLVEVLDAMEREGITLDRDELGRLSMEYQKRRDALAREIQDMAGRSFNINSPKQVSEVLFDEIGLKSSRKTRSGKSTSSEVLEALQEEHPLPGKILEYRHIEKMIGTYVESLPKLINRKTGRVHTSYNQFQTATGRLSSSNPNLQNIPIRAAEGREIRRTFLPNGSDHLLLAADYSQVELRVLAHLCGDENLRQAFREKKDIHGETASRIFNVHPEEVDKDMRAQAKTINFGLLYGMGPHRLSRELGISRNQAQNFIEEYFNAFPKVREWIETTLEEARYRGYVTTLTGRRRMLPNITSKNGNFRSNAERIAINTPIQGASADMIKIAMIEVYGELKKRQTGARLVLQVHDELVLSVPREEVEEIKEMVKGKMEKAMTLKVPLVVDVATGENWAEC